MLTNSSVPLVQGCILCQAGRAKAERPKVNYKVFFQHNAVIIAGRRVASVWRGREGEEGQMPSLNFESSYMYTWPCC